MLNLMDGSGRKYSADRDILNLFEVIARKSAENLHPIAWPDALKEFAGYHGMTEADAVDAGGVLGRFIVACTRSPGPDIAHAMSTAGYDRLPAAARLAVDMMVGRYTMSAFHHYAREAYRRNDGPFDEGSVAQAADQAVHANR